MDDTDRQPTQCEDVPQGTVYLVTAGSYSEYEVVAAFSSRALAEEFMTRDTARLPKSADIEEYPLNPTILQHRAGLCYYVVHMWRDGSVRYIELPRGIVANSNSHDLLPLQDGSGQHLLMASVWASSKQHAVKIANDKRAELIALNQWPEEEA